VKTLEAFAPSLRCAAFDFDGVFTDNSVYVSETGEEFVRCSRADGIGLAVLRALGICCVVISTEKNPVVAARCRKLGIEFRQNCDDKVAALSEFLAAEGISMAETSFLGNDVNDLAVLSGVGFPAAVQDAFPAVLQVARWVGQCRGGHGAVREFCEFIAIARQGTKL